MILLLTAGCARPEATYAPRTPAPLPSGSALLRLATAEPNTPPGRPATCGDALLEPADIHLGDTTLEVVSIATGAVIDVVWPRGFSARSVNGTAELVAPSGDVVGREGETLTGIGGNGGKPFTVCTVNGTTYGPAS